MQGLSKAAYARRRGVSKAMVSKYARADWLVYFADGSIDAEASDRVIDSNRDPSRGGRNGWSSPRSAPATPPVEDDADEDDGQTLDAVLNNAMLDEQGHYPFTRYAIDAALEIDPLSRLMSASTLRLSDRQSRAIDMAYIALPAIAGGPGQDERFRAELGRLFGRLRVALEHERDALETELRALFEASRKATTHQ